MKKLFALILAGCMMLSLCSCDVMNFVKMKGEEVEINYDTEKMEKNLEKIEQDGLYVELLVTSYESGDKPETSRIAYAETKDMFYFVGDGMETYYDFTDETKTVMYDKNDEGVWVRSEIVYEETGMTREQMEANCELQASAIFNYLGSYEQFNGQKVKMTKTTVAGRECDEFNISVGLLGYGMNYICAVDPETGMCLKWSFSASAGMEGSASVSFTCNKFETPYKIKLPADYIEAEDTGEEQGSDSSVNADGGKDNANSAEGRVSVNGNGNIFIADADTAFNRNHGYGQLSIEFVYADGEKVKFEEVWEMPAADWGFSTTDTVCKLTVVTVYAEQNVIVIQYEGITEEEFTFGIRDLTDITYTSVAGKEIRTAQGEVIEGFTCNDF